MIKYFIFEKTFFNDSKIVVTFTLLDRASNTGLPNVNENTLNGNN